MKRGPFRWFCAAIALVVACAEERVERADPPSEVCPTGYRADAERTERVRRLLATAPEGASLLDATAVSLTCWGPAKPSTIQEDGTLRLDDELPDAEAAARLGHLLLHRREGLPMSGQARCDALSVAEKRERDAHELEARLREAFRAPPLPAGTLEAVLDGYRARCR